MFRLTSDVAEHLRAGGSLIVPSRQRAHAVRLAQAAGALAGGLSVWASADVLGVASWLRREAERRALATAAAPRLLSAAEEWWLWRECAVQASRHLALLDGAALAASLQRASELAADYHLRLPRAPPDTEAGLLHETQRAFAARCEALGAGSVSALLERLPPPAAARAGPALMVRGFDAHSPRLGALVGAAALRARVAPDAAPAALTAFSDTQEELARIAAWCEARLGRAGDARLLVMLPGAAGVRERLATLIRHELDPRGTLNASPPAPALVGIEGGQPLAQLPLIAHTLTGLRWLAGEELEFESLGSWLRSAQWLRAAASVRARLVQALRERGFLRLDLRGFAGALQLLPRELLGAARELDAQLTRAAAALPPGQGSPRLWSERIRAGLSAAGWPGTLAADSAGQQTVLRWHELLEEFGGLTPSVPTLSRAAALGVLADLAARSPFRPADEDVAVTISPLLADPVIHYDGIWVAGLNADVLPQPVQPDPFLPLQAQRAAGVPGASVAGRLAQAQLLLNGWRAATRELVLSAPEHAGDLELLVSPLVHTRAQAPATSAPGSLAQRQRREGQTESLIDVSGERWNLRVRLPRGTRSLDLQNACPFRAYAELRLGASPPEVAEPGIPATVRGLLLHAALEILWQRLRDARTLAELPGAALDELIGQSVAQAAQALLLQPPNRRRRRTPYAQLDLFSAIPAPLARECRRAARLMRRLCELERTRGPFQVEQAERQTQLTLAGATLHMRIDRVDRLPGGGLAVLDYKTGAPASADWYGERPTHPQLLAYAQALGEEVVALATVNLTAQEVRFEGIARDGRLLPRVKAVQGSPGSTAQTAWQERRGAWRATLERLIGAFLAGDAAVDPKPGACTYCHVTDICRIGERARAAAEEGADG